jgi:competence protein ComEA
VSSSSPFPGQQAAPSQEAEPAQEAEPPLWEGTPRSGSNWLSVASDRVGELADRLGTSVASIVVGAVILCGGAVVVVGALSGGDSAPAELSIPYAAPVGATPDSTPPTTAEAEVLDELTVHAAGAVRHPGVYVVTAEARVADLLSAAGGPTADADLDRVNLAAPLFDGSRVYVPSVGQEQPPSVVAGGEHAPGGAAGSGGGTDPGTTIDINRASASELERLPGVGPATAAAIIGHREQHGPFAQVDDLLSVRGIGEAKLAALRDLVHV